MANMMSKAGMPVTVCVAATIPFSALIMETSSVAFVHICHTLRFVKRCKVDGGTGEDDNSDDYANYAAISFTAVTPIMIG